LALRSKSEEVRGKGENTCVDKKKKAQRNRKVMARLTCESSELKSVSGIKFRKKKKKKGSGQTQKEDNLTIEM